MAWHTETPYCGHSRDAGLYCRTGTQLKATPPVNDAGTSLLTPPPHFGLHLSVFYPEPGLYFWIQAADFFFFLASSMLLMSIWPELTNVLSTKPFLFILDTFSYKNRQYHPGSQGWGWHPLTPALYKRAWNSNKTRQGSGEGHVELKRASKVGEVQVVFPFTAKESVLTYTLTHTFND